MNTISIQTRADAYTVVINSGHRDRFASTTDFEAAVSAVWSAVRDGMIGVSRFNEICNAIIENG